VNGRSVGSSIDSGAVDLRVPDGGPFIRMIMGKRC